MGLSRIEALGGVVVWGLNLAAKQTAGLCATVLEAHILRSMQLRARIAYNGDWETGGFLCRSM